MSHRVLERAVVFSAALVISIFIHSATAADGEPRTVIDAEYAFAAAAKPLGVRGAFLKYLAPDSIICSPAPVNGVASTAADKPNKDTLEWYPTYSQTAGSADLGYTTGPWTYRSADGKGEAHGTFLSVWRKQPDDTWRVVLDCGISHKKFDSAPQGLKASAAGATTGTAADTESTGNWKDPVAAAEARFTAAAARDPSAAFKQFAAADSRVLIRGSQPAVGPAAGEALVAAQKLGNTWQQVFASESRDGTLGYAWGYVGEAGAEKPTAVYVNIWRRAKPSAPWQIAAQSVQILPTKKA
jgi:ketosteroid isomerase-like protein